MGIFVINVTNGLTNEQALEAMGGDETTINNMTGYLIKNDDVFMFDFEKNDRVVMISSTDKNAIGDFLIA